MADIIEFNPEERAARRNGSSPVTDADVLRDVLLSIIADARDLEHARQMAAEALDDFEGYDGGKAPA
jgi:hypothetical protein